MKKIIKIVAIIMAFACLAAVLVACSSSGSVSFRKAKIEPDYKPATVYAEANVSIVTALSGMNAAGGANGILFKARKLNDDNKDVYTLLNVVTGDILVSETLSEINTYSYGETAFYSITQTDADNEKYTTALYTGAGAVVKDGDGLYATVDATFDEGKPVVNHIAEDIFLFGDSYYRVAKTGYDITFIRKKTKFFSFDTDIDYSNDNYYYYLSNNKAYVFNKNLDLVSTYYVHGNYSQSKIFVLADGNLFVQATYQLVDTVEDYTYISGGKKYLLKTYIVNAKTGKASEEDVDFLVDYLVSDFDDVGLSFSGSAKNVAKVYPIEDEMLLNGTNDVQYVLLTNGLKCKGRVDQMINGQEPGTTFEVIGENLLFETPVGGKLYTAGGKEIGDISDLDDDDYNDSFIKANGMLFDHSLNLVFDYTAQGYELEGMLNHSVILSKEIIGEDHYYLYKGGASPVEITGTLGDVDEYAGYFYSVKNADGMYVYYNDNGEAVLGVKAKLQFVTANEATRLFYADVPKTDGIGTVRQYYLFK